MPNLIITTCGISLLTNQAIDGQRKVLFDAANKTSRELTAAESQAISSAMLVAMEKLHDSKMTLEDKCKT